MITVHKTEIARQNNTVNIFWDPPQKEIIRLLPTNHVFRGAHVLLSSHPAHQDGHFNVILCVILPLKRNKLHF